MNIAEYLQIEGISLSVDSKVRHFHTNVWIPEWYSKYFDSFHNQVMTMASPKKPFKATDYFKVKAGYPHEVTAERKAEITSQGCFRDKLSSKRGITIPKIDVQDFIRLNKNLIAFTAPSDKDFIRDITVYDDTTDERLAFIYVINRKAQVIAAWCEPKHKGKYTPKIPTDALKSLKYEREA